MKLPDVPDEYDREEIQKIIRLVEIAFNQLIAENQELRKKVDKT